MNKRSLFLLGILSFSLAGCASYTVGGNQDKFTREHVTKNLIVGKTTKNDVIRNFGQPDPDKVAIYSDGTETWYYYGKAGFDLLSAAGSLVPVSGASQAASVAKNTTEDKKGRDSLAIHFDKNDVVSSWSR